MRGEDMCWLMFGEEGKCGVRRGGSGDCAMSFDAE
jgi:hypothetical protein